MKCFIFIIFILLSTVLHGQGVKFEAEDAILEGVNKASSRSGFSGTGYVTGFDKATDKVTFNFSWEKAGIYQLYIGFASPNGDKKNYVIVNGQTLGEVLFASTSKFKELDAGKIYLTNGANSIAIAHSWGWFEVDYIRIDEVKPSTEWNISPTPVNPNVTPEALSMYQYLLNNFGKTTFAGQFQSDGKLYNESSSEIRFLKDLTGKYPAVYGNDLINYTPSRVENGATTKATEDILKWYKERNGMVTLTWHWNAPTDLYNTAEQPWWKGFYTTATSFDIGWVMNNPDSEKYQLILRDIDTIAKQLKIYQQNNIPILWRPLHEAEGAWFWWGAKGPEACKKLWILLYDRLTNHHKINNLIWVWTTTDSNKASDWYPGDQYVDILGVDVYLQAGDYSVSSAMFDNLRNIFGGRKMLTMSENGTLPDPDMMKQMDAKWLYVCTWVGDFIFDGKNNSTDYINSFFNHNEVTTLDELPTYWLRYTRNVEVKKPIRAKLSPNPVNDCLLIEFDNNNEENSVAIIDSAGKIIMEEKGTKQIEFNTMHLKKGFYMAKITGKNSSNTYKFIKK